MINKPRENCGIAVSFTPVTTYKLLLRQQHRGQDMAGIASHDKDGIKVLRYAGFVDAFKPRGIVSIFGKGGKPSIGHVRYKTNCDSEMFPYLYETEGRGFKAIENIMKKIPAAYTVAILDETGVWILRDGLGMRPGWIGKDRRGRTVVASEDTAIWEIGGEPEEELKPGHAIFIPNDPKAKYESQKVVEVKAAAGCIFELQYLLNPNSRFHGTLAKSVREEAGRELYRLFPFSRQEMDFVTYIPYSPLDAALTYSKESGIPFAEIFYKMNNKRAFMMPTMKEREESIKSNLYINPDYKGKLRGKRIIIKDDSMVRNVNARVAINMLFDEGVEWYGLLLYTSMIGGEIGGIMRGCHYGVAMPPSDDFATVMWGRDEENIRLHTGPKEHPLDFLGFMPHDNMVRVAGISACTYCMGGDEPVERLEIAK
ncbi:MAG: hypothetical protein QMD85_04360 [Candidatus Aenigmarchaeota archaeon]|nr:hypothetical protein [Candidatus Aenigmarchaeota archaeon]MDI6722805.1 hypothetical protein [Candidatus Aenigmarchaeota archaeon]